MLRMFACSYSPHSDFSFTSSLPVSSLNRSACLTPTASSTHSEKLYQQPHPDTYASNTHTSLTRKTAGRFSYFLPILNFNRTEYNQQFPSLSLKTGQPRWRHHPLVLYMHIPHCFSAVSSQYPHNNYYSLQCCAFLWKDNVHQTHIRV